MNQVVLTVVSHANNNSRGHIRDEEVVGALELCGCTGWMKCELSIYYADLAAVFTWLKHK